jgi:hypothetical protein
VVAADVDNDGVATVVDVVDVTADVAVDDDVESVLMLPLQLDRRFVSAAVDSSNTPSLRLGRSNPVRNRRSEE